MQTICQRFSPETREEIIRASKGEIPTVKEVQEKYKVINPEAAEAIRGLTIYFEDTEPKIRELKNRAIYLTETGEIEEIAKGKGIFTSLKSVPDELKPGRWDVLSFIANNRTFDCMGGPVLERLRLKKKVSPELYAERDRATKEYLSKVIEVSPKLLPLETEARKKKEEFEKSQKELSSMKWQLERARTRLKEAEEELRRYTEEARILGAEYSYAVERGRIEVAEKKIGEHYKIVKEKIVPLTEEIKRLKEDIVRLPEEIEDKSREVEEKRREMAKTMDELRKVAEPVSRAKEVLSGISWRIAKEEEPIEGDYPTGFLIKCFVPGVLYKHYCDEYDKLKRDIISYKTELLMKYGEIKIKTDEDRRKAISLRLRRSHFLKKLDKYAIMGPDKDLKLVEGLGILKEDCSISGPIELPDYPEIYVLRNGEWKRIR